MQDTGFSMNDMNESSAARPLGWMLAFEVGLGVLALALAWLFGLQPWLDLALEFRALLLGLLILLPMLIGFYWMIVSQAVWVNDLKAFVKRVIVPIFSSVGPFGIFLVALAAGVFEELLFRGVIQAGLVGPLGPWTALIIASLLFGLVHAMTVAYFMITFLMGIYLGLAYHWSGSLLVPMIAHFLYDWLVLHYYLRKR